MFPGLNTANLSRVINKDEAIIEADHYGLEMAKERIQEYLAVQQRVKEQLKDAILCLVGPPPMWGRLPWAAL